MLQHSRASAGNKEPTDINALADEYLKLSFHGMRAKDKTFNATLQTEFDTSIGRINVVPQDLGRVLLNLYNNAFYATAEKAKKSGKEYAPLVAVTTKKISVNMVGANSSPIASEGFKITVRDNGIGISQKIVDKIFQPFFTGKPTGQGTGLGLSLSYDIIKAHGGEIKVESKEDEGSEFIINLPTIGNF
jgi:signal transduction histidine kinase